jgi:MraZ protein
MLLGESVQKLDAKNRVTLPAKLRGHFTDGAVISKGFEQCLVVYNRDAWEAFTEAQMGRLDPFSKQGRTMSRHLYAGSAEVEVDRQGRIMIPPAQLSHAQLDRDIVVAGLRDRLEIWDLAAWRSQEAEFEGSVADVAESLSQQ